MQMIEIMGGQSVDAECYEIIQTYTASLIHVNKNPRADVQSTTTPLGQPTKNNSYVNQAVQQPVASIYAITSEGCGTS